MLHYGMGKLDKDKIRSMVTDNPTLTMQEVANHFGCSREYVRQVAGHLRDLKLNREIKKILLRRIAKDKMISSNSTPIKYLLDRGLDVDCVLMKTVNIQVKSKEYIVNGSRCTVHLCQKAISKRHSKYAHFNLRPAQSSNPILVIDIIGYSQKIYILPSDLPVSAVYINLDPRPIPYRNIKSTYDWSKYEEAWHLLGK